MKRSEISPAIKGALRNVIIDIMGGEARSIEEAHASFERHIDNVRARFLKARHELIEDVAFPYTVWEYIDNHEADSYEFITDAFKRLAP